MCNFDPCSLLVLPTPCIPTMAGYCSLNPYGIIVVTERMNVQIIASSTHFGLVSEVLFSGNLVELFGQYKLHPHLE